MLRIRSLNSQIALKCSKTFGDINIGGRVEWANLLAGYDLGLNAINGDAQIGTVRVGGDWAASNLVAGVMNSASSNTSFGDANDASIGAGNPSILAEIGHVTINGLVFGSPASVNNSDHFGLVAEQVVAVTIGGHAVALTSGPHNDDVSIGETSDFTVHEV